jgi:hypothetical protein
LKKKWILKNDSARVRFTIYERRALSSRVVLLVLLLFIVSGVAAQQTSIITDQVYGSDPLLINGKYYTFFPPLNTGGNQFFADPQFEIGSATIRGVTFTDLILNYDIYNQQLLLKYKNNIGAENLIIVSDAWLEKFNLKGIHFEVISIQDTLKQIFQVLGTGANRILFYWKKDLKLDSFYGAKNYTFSLAGKEMNLLAGNQYWNNKSFYSLFDLEKRMAVKEYLRKRKINVRKAIDQTMTELINYCNSLYSK